MPHAIARYRVGQRRVTFVGGFKRTGEDFATLGFEPTYQSGPNHPFVACDINALGYKVEERSPSDRALSLRMHTLFLFTADRKGRSVLSFTRPSNLVRCSS